jgi:hypothetical protein
LTHFHSALLRVFASPLIFYPLLSQSRSCPVVPSNDFCVDATAVIVDDSNINEGFVDKVEFTLASSIYTEFFMDEGTINGSVQNSSSKHHFLSIPTEMYRLPFACTNIYPESRGVWYRLETTDDTTFTCYNLTARATGQSYPDLQLAVFAGSTCPTPLNSNNDTDMVAPYYGPYSTYGYNIHNQNDIPPDTCVAMSTYANSFATTDSTSIVFPVAANETYYIFVGSTTIRSGTVTVKFSVRTVCFVCFCFDAGHQKMPHFSFHLTLFASRSSFVRFVLIFLDRGEIVLLTTLFVKPLKYKRFHTTVRETQYSHLGMPTVIQSV